MSDIPGYNNGLNGAGLTYGAGQAQWPSLGAGWMQQQAPVAQADPGAFSNTLLNTNTDALNAPAGSVPGADSTGMGWGNFFGSTNKNGMRSDGWGGLAIGGAQALSSAFLGMKQYQLAQQALSENKRQFSLNFDNQRKTINTELEDRQRARVASNAGAYQSVGDYMQKNGV
jgi:hypothetical protein